MSTNYSSAIPQEDRLSLNRINTAGRNLGIGGSNTTSQNPRNAVNSLGTRDSNQPNSRGADWDASANRNQQQTIDSLIHGAVSAIDNLIQKTENAQANGDIHMQNGTKLRIKKYPNGGQ